MDTLSAMSGSCGLPAVNSYRCSGFAILMTLAAAGAFATAAAAESVGFNWFRTEGGTYTNTIMSANEDPFVGLYLEGRSRGSGGYTNLSTWGTNTHKGITVIAPALCDPPGGGGDNVEYGQYWAHAREPWISVFQRAGGGGVGIEEPRSWGAFTLEFSGIPYPTYDVYVAALNAYLGTGSLAITGGVLGVTFKLGRPIDGDQSGQSWNTPTRITDTGGGGVSTGNWMVATALKSASLRMTYSTLGGWKGGIGCIQFVQASGSGTLLIVR